MDLKQLEAFVYVVKLNSFSKAADTIFLSQPTISSHISSLEKELGTQLLIRSTKEVYPTKSGLDLYIYAQNMLALRDEALQSVGKMGNHSKGEISLLSSSVPAQYLLPSLISKFQHKYPNIIIKVTQSDSVQANNLLSNCKYDFGISGTRSKKDKFIDIPFYNDTLVFAVPSSLMVNSHLSKEQLEKFILSQQFVIREDGSGTQKELEKLLSSINLSTEDLKVSCQFDNTHSVLQAVAGGAGIAFVSKAATTMYTQTGLVKTVQVKDMIFNRNFYLLNRKEMILLPIQKLFQTFLIDYYAK